MKRKYLFLGTLLASSLFLAPPGYGEQPPDSSDLGWWHGKYATGNWFGVRDTLEDHGVHVFGNWKGVFYGLTGGGGSAPRGTYAEEFQFGLILDFGKIAGLEGLKFKTSVRYRDGRGPNFYTDTGASFSVSSIESGRKWRLMPFYFTYVTPELFGIEHFLTISGGWQDPWEYFADQPSSRLFTNAAITTVKGIGGVNHIPFTSSYVAWGGYVKIKPSDVCYVMGGVYMADPNGAETSNHGHNFDGTPGRNGIYVLGEMGYTPRIGSAKLPGKYAIGTIYWDGKEEDLFPGKRHSQGRNAYYAQIDQMLYREHKEHHVEHHTGKEVITRTSHGENVLATLPADDHEYGPRPIPERLDLDFHAHEGLYAFAFFNYAPSFNNAMPFYFHVGAVYKGLFPGRNHDQLGVVFGMGSYSRDKANAETAHGIYVHQTTEAVVEVDYRFQVNRWAYIQPFYQYIIRPNGTGKTSDLGVVGVQMAITF